MRELEGYFKGLADSSRLRILNLLLYGELCGCDIQYVLGLSQTNVSRHLTYLKHAGLVADRREGYRVFYQLADTPSGTIQALFELLRAVFKADRNLRQDLAGLKEAVKEGACTMQQKRPWPGLTRLAALAAAPDGRSVRQRG
ncbi:MAG: winged helix-turn-helix transcriptional regulator [Acidobacteria bacterium]|nr:winged helix-turn-helix transcriptional regulator [Acidobacteriota bacterium]